MSTIKIRAAVMHAAGAPLVIQELQLADPGPGEVRVSLKACAICHSDISMLNGDWAGSEVPCVAGHEASGIIESTGAGVSSVAVGDHVVVTLVRSCGNCHACRAGHTVACSGKTTLDTESRLTDSEGRRVAQGIRTAAFAEAAVVHESQVVKIPHDIPFTSAALLGCGVITGFCSVTNIAGVEAGSKVVIIGAGGLGLNTVQGAALSGATTIIAIDVLDIKLQAALDLGATHVINALQTDPVAEVLALCSGGADYVFVSTGRSQSFVQSIDMLSKFGSSVILGMPPDEDKMFAVDSHSLTTGKKILGSKMGDTCIQKDIPKLIGLYQQGKLKLDELVSKTFPLHEINEAIETSERGEALRNVITYD